MLNIYYFKCTMYKVFITKLYLIQMIVNYIFLSRVNYGNGYKVSQDLFK